MRRFLLTAALVVCTFFVALAQGGKLSADMRLILADREGKISLNEAKQEMQRLQRNFRTQQTMLPMSEQSQMADEGDLPIATPFVKNGVKMSQCWIVLNDDNVASLEALGVQILARFEGKVTANVPVNKLEKVAELSNVVKVSAARKLKKNTYRTRVLTNVDDVLTYSADAQTAGFSTETLAYADFIVLHEF